MIQRRQTLWLLLATVCAVLTFLYPFATGEEQVESTSMSRSAELVAGNNFFILVLTIVSIGISSVTIFLFKDRKLQMKLCLAGVVVALTILVIYVVEMRKLLSSTPALWSLLSLAILVSYVMAYRGIRHDEKLVKSLDKLR